MTTTIAQIIAGIETRLLTISGLRTNDISPGQIEPPCAIVGVPPIDDYNATLSSYHWDVSPTITVFTSAAMDRAGQLALCDYADHTGTKSIRAAIDADKTLGGIVEYCVVKSFRPLGLQEVGVVGYYGGVFELDVAVGS